MSEPHFDAAWSLLRAAVPQSITIHDTDASGVAGQAAAYPFIVLSAGVPVPEYAALGSCTTGARGSLRVTHTALAPSAVRALVGATRKVLEGQPLPCPGGLELSLSTHLDVTADRDVKLVGATATAWPYYAVDVYTVRSTT